MPDVFLLLTIICGVMVMMFNTTVNNISVISWWLV